MSDFLILLNQINFRLSFSQSLSQPALLWHIISLFFSSFNLILFPVYMKAPNFLNLQWETRQWWWFLWCPWFIQRQIALLPVLLIPWDMAMASKDVVLSKEASTFGVLHSSRKQVLNIGEITPSFLIVWGIQLFPELGCSFIHFLLRHSRFLHRWA